MALINKEGKSISFECSDLIEELENDICEFGSNLMVEVVTENIEGVTIYKDYNFIDQEDTAHEFTKKEGERTTVVDAAFLLRVYKKQNSVF